LKWKAYNIIKEANILALFEKGIHVDGLKRWLELFCFKNPFYLRIRGLDLFCFEIHFILGFGRNHNIIKGKKAAAQENGSQTKRNN